MIMTQSNTAVLLQSKKKKPSNSSVRQPTPMQRALSKRVMDEYKCALLKPKTQ